MSDFRDPNHLDWNAPISLQDLALLCGVSYETTLSEVARQGCHTDAESIHGFVIPDEWMSSGRRRCGEFAARTGSYDMREALRYFARLESESR